MNTTKHIKQFLKKKLFESQDGEGNELLDDGGKAIYESNTRLVEWEDGSRAEKRMDGWTSCLGDRNVIACWLLKNDL